MKNIFLSVLALAIIIAIFVSLSSAAGPCDPLQCNRQSQNIGNPYCSSNNVYIKYREYYCSGFDCVYRDMEKMIDDCKSLGCRQGICITCNDAACRSKSGYYGGVFCKDGDVFRQYRNYECRFEKGCAYEEINRLVEECVGDCRNGFCGCDPVDCNKRSGYYGDSFCKADDDVYREYRQYYCSGYSSDSRCVYNRTEVKIADCRYSCSRGLCISLCQPDCTANSGFYSDAYCKDGDVYRKYRDYYCVGDSCAYNEKETVVQDCKKLCKNAECIDSLCSNYCDSWSEWIRKNSTYERSKTCYNYTSSCALQISYNVIARRNITTEEKYRNITFDIDAESMSKDITIDYPDTRLYNGLLSGSKSIAINTDGRINQIRFVTRDTNSIAPLIISVDNEKLYRNISLLGDQVVDVNKDGKRIKITTLSPGWQFWAQSYYDLMDIKIGLTIQTFKENEFDFSLGKEIESFTKALLVMPENLTATVNGNPIRIDSISRDAFKRENTIKFTPSENTKTYGKATLKVWYLEEK